ncbi:MAG TPA: hypothetical protein VK986_16430, partial [Tepidisphaeraceae bacterium]|nr:hypothetical protein [Tepidisphaeraceae bacterium]
SFMGFERGKFDDVMASLWSAEGRPRGGRIEWAVVPWWPVMCGTALLPAVWTAGWWRRRRGRRRVGLCARCGYDVRATPDGGRVLAHCPECGAPTAPAGRASGRGVD